MSARDMATKRTSSGQGPRFRQSHRRGMHSITVTVPVCDVHIGALVAKGYLAPADRDKTRAIKLAIESFLSHSARADAAIRSSSTVEKTQVTQGGIEGHGREVTDRKDRGQRRR
jgi:hypothetical protein